MPKISIFIPYIQYPWRLLWITTLSSVMILNSKEFLKNTSKTTLLGLSFLLLYVGIFNAIFYAKPISYINNSDLEWREYPGTTTSDNELNPRWFNLNASLGIVKKVYLRDINNSEIVSDERILLTNWTGSKMEYKISIEKPMYVIQKTTYFPGWEVFVDGIPTQINYQDEEFPGVIIFPVRSGKHSISAKYTNNNPSKKIGIYFSILSMLLWGSLIFFKTTWFLHKQTNLIFSNSSLQSTTSSNPPS